MSKSSPETVSVLDSINSPADLWDLKLTDLEKLAGEIRKLILEVVSRNGGHLASNLGVVELTIALHYVFRAPEDRIVWDVGHQAYTHKLLTGRKDLFSTLRQKGGISGFPKRRESLYDCFDVGHSGTSLSAALGIAEALERLDEAGKVVAVIGDGSMTAGLALEGLNQAGEYGKRLVVILNDNEMSIAPNVGAMSSYLSRLLTGGIVNRVKRETENFLKSIPKVGESFLQVAKKAEESFKSLIYPGMLFEELGYQYIGPLKGHRMDRLIVAFRNARRIEGPVLIHVGTEKGKGYEPAEKNPARFHGVGPFNLETGNPIRKSAVPSYTDVFSEALVEAAGKDDRIIAITAAMPEGTGLDRFAREYPDRFFDVGIAEQHAVTFAAGLATQGFRPVVAIYSTFLQRAYDQIIHDVCLQGLPVVFAIDRGGIVGEDGPTHNGVFDLSFLRAIPSITLMAPGDEAGLRSSLATALAIDGPCSFRYPRGRGVGVPLDEPEVWEVGKGKLLREGMDVTLVAAGSGLHPVLDAAEKLKDVGIDAAVIDARFVKPLDSELIFKWGRQSGNIITIEENALMGGFGSAVLEAASDRGENCRIHRLGLPDTFIEQATQAEIRAALGIDADGIMRAVRKVLGDAGS
ncbi:MAG TPA: 1-deoxy-D-xylulose-5-phosphate synthase [Proteobacteria bacterium]|nr:1-deoxy-D-xylulose-5-phosphate synthase [bacterium BMS3Abin14]HDL52722.1 1-deoxy-D-xylulose-5-phosphate synthase [Pseudomonadota bacterium]